MVTTTDSPYAVRTAALVGGVFGSVNWGATPVPALYPTLVFPRTPRPACNMCPHPTHIVKMAYRYNVRYKLLVPYIVNTKERLPNRYTGPCLRMHHRP